MVESVESISKMFSYPSLKISIVIPKMKLNIWLCGMNINHHILSIQMAFSVRMNNRFFENVWNFIKDPRKKVLVVCVCACGKKRDRFVTLRQHVSKECVLEQNNSIKFVFFVFDAHTLYTVCLYDGLAGWLYVQPIHRWYTNVISVGYSSQHLCSCVCVCMGVCVCVLYQMKCFIRWWNRFEYCLPE